jgi:DNA-binding NtrC family response regulator
VGSGREWLARTIHQHSNAFVSDAAPPLIPLACATLTAELLSSTLAAAIQAHPSRANEHRSTGTLLLLDLDQLPREAFAEFARLLTGAGTSLRLMATSRLALADLIQTTELPTELALACGTIEINLPPLTQRLEDLPLWVQALVERNNVPGERQLAGVQPQTLDLLATYGWPGNVTELDRILSLACSEAAGPLLLPTDLPREFHLALGAQARPKRAVETIKLPEFLGEVERELITRALAQTKGNKAKAARLLGISRPTLLRRLARLKLE